MYWLARTMIRLLLPCVAKINVEGMQENIQDRIGDEGFIATSNHLGRLDAALVYYYLDRRDVTMLVAEKYQKSAVFRWFTRSLDAIFIDRFNADLNALRAALNRVKQGWVLVMAPEGTRSTTGALIEAHGGASYLAAKSGAWVLPVAVSGTEDTYVVSQLRRLRRAQIKVKVGRPFKLPPLQNRERDAQLPQYTDEIMCRIAALLPEKYHGFYAGHPRLKELLAEDLIQDGAEEVSQ